MLTDIQGYSEKSSHSSRSELIHLIQTHNKLIRPILEFYGAEVVKTMGDAFLCVFESATDAAVCALAIQIIINKFNQLQKPGDWNLNIRIMINSGDVTVTQNDILGDPVNIIARMEKLPEFSKGGIGISESTYLLMNQKKVEAIFVGEKVFKEISQPIKIYSLPLKQKLDPLPGNLAELAATIVTQNSKVAKAARFQR